MRIILLSTLLLSACAAPPTTPTSTTQLQAPTRNTATLGPALGEGTATNRENVAGWFTLVVFDYSDGENQIDKGRLSLDAAPGQTVRLTTGVADENDCTTYQVDIFWNLPRATRYTLSDTRNYPPIASRMVYPLAHCRLPPSDPPKPPVVPPPPPPPPADPPPVDGCPYATVRPFDSFTAKVIAFDVRVPSGRAALSFEVFGGGVLFSRIEPRVFTGESSVTLPAPGGYFHQSYQCTDGRAVVALIGDGR